MIPKKLEPQMVLRAHPMNLAIKGLITSGFIQGKSLFSMGLPMILWYQYIKWFLGTSGKSMIKYYRNFWKKGNSKSGILKKSCNIFAKP